MAEELILNCQLNTNAVPAADQPRLVYLLVEAQPGPRVGTQQLPVNLGLALDISESMRLPVLSRAQFEELARLGQVREVISDGIPVWTFPHIPDHIRRAAPSNLDAVKQALREAVSSLEAQDIFSLVAYAGRAERLLSQLPGTERDRIPDVVQRLDAVRLGDDTAMAEGMDAALREVQPGQSRGMLTRIIVLTDGFTKDPERVSQLAAQAGESGIAMSTIGVGTDFNERLLVGVADASHGNAYFARTPQEIPGAFAKELEAVGSVTLRHLAATVRLSAGVELRRAYRVRPAIAMVRDAQAVERALTLDLGDLEMDRPPALLLELIVPSRAPGVFRIAQTTISYDVPNAQGGADHGEVRADSLLEYSTKGMGALNPTVMNTVEKVTTFSLQTRALDDVAAGNIVGATTKLRSAATRLLEMGETDLANDAETEAQRLEHEGKMSPEGEKALRYSTRRLA